MLGCNLYVDGVINIKYFIDRSCITFEISDRDICLARVHSLYSLYLGEYISLYYNIVDTT